MRLVGAPPSSIGNFGGDTDNWMWPRHTGDFSIFRVYAGADNRPAAYSPENRPYRADKFLKISLQGVDEGDFAMVMGFPGSTQRYITSAEIADMLAVSNPQRIFIRGERQRILWDAMMADPAVRIQYASKYRSSSNYWKNSIGMSRGLEKAPRQRAQSCAGGRVPAMGRAEHPARGGFHRRIAESPHGIGGNDCSRCRFTISFRSLLRGIELIRPVSGLLDRTAPKKEADAEKIEAWLGNWYKDYSAATDRKVAKRMLAIARENMKELPSFYTEIIDKDFGGDIDAYVDHIYDRSQFTTPEGFAALLTEYTPEKVEADAAYPFVKSVMEKYSELSALRRPHTEGYNEGMRKYVAGLMRREPAKAWSPDANFTIRLTYGRVLPYNPADGIRYNHYTTLKGVIEKENPQNPQEFTVPEKLKELYAARDFGPYANAAGELPVAFWPTSTLRVATRARRY